MQTCRFILTFAEMLLSPAILLYLVARPIAIPANQPQPNIAKARMHLAH
jgi:hypothetical protein